MISPTAGAVRHARACLVAAIMLTLSVTGHLAGGGRVPHPVALAVLFGVACVPAYLFARRLLGFATLVALLGAGQYAVHVVLTSQPSPHDHGAGAMHHHDGSSSLVMVAAHVAATVIAAGVLAHADALLWIAWRLLSSIVRFAAAVAVPAGLSARSLAGLGVELPLSSQLDGWDADPRGPPLFVRPRSG